MRKIERTDNSEFAEALPWERQKGEGDKPYHYFVAYRDMGFRRSIRTLAQQEGLGFRNLAKYSINWNWQQRVAAWDDELDRVKRESSMKEIREMTKRHSKQSMAFQRALILPVEAILKKINLNSSDIAEFENQPLHKLFDYALDASRVFATIVDVERKSRGEPNEILRQDVTSQGKQIHVILPPGINLNTNEVSFSAAEFEDMDDANEMMQLEGDIDAD